MSTKHDHTIDELIEMRSDFQDARKEKATQIDELFVFLEQHKQKFPDLSDRILEGALDALTDEGRRQELEQVVEHFRAEAETVVAILRLYWDAEDLMVLVQGVNILINNQEAGLDEGWDDALA